MRAEKVDQVVQALAERAGLAATGTMRDRLVHYLHRAAAADGAPVEEYATRVVSSPPLLQELIEDVTVQESSFFRDGRQFDALVEHVLPRVAGPVRIWSAGCAGGQEPYSLAMLLRERGYADAKVIATDISGQALARAREGRYPQGALRGLTASQRDSAMVRDGDLWSVREPIRRLVSFATHNLAADPPPFPAGHCQVIFCRNVLIYFRRDTLLRVLDRIRTWLPPGGVLFLGYSESLWQVTDMFELIRLGDAFVYRRSADADAPALPDRPLRVPAGVRARPAGPSGAVGNGEPADPTAPGIADGDPDVTVLLRRGEVALAGGDLRAAATAFRQAAYLDTSQPLAHFQLGLVLEAEGHTVAATRAFRAARSALRRLDRTADDAELVGYRPAALVRLIDRKLGDGR